jgi:hypothetical protein
MKMIRRLFWLLFLCACQTLSAADAPWFSSLSSFEHHDSGRSHVFSKAKFKGNSSGNNQVDTLTSSNAYPSGYNMVYLNSKNIFIYGGGYGDVAGSIGAFVAKVDPQTLAPIWTNQLINTSQNGEWDYPGSVAILGNGHLYVIYGYRLSKIDPKTGRTIATLELPTGQGVPANTSFDGFNATADGVLVMKSVYRQAGCSIQGPDALLNCPDPTDVPPSILVSVDPHRMRVIDTITLSQPVAARPTIGIQHGNTYVYLAEDTTVVRYRVKKGMFTADNSWQPGTITLSGQTTASSYVVMGDWIVGQVNSLPSATSLSIIAINQTNASQQFSIQPFAGDPIPPLAAAAFSFAGPGGVPAISWAPASVSADPRTDLIYATDSLPGEIAAIELTKTGLQIVWKANQTTTEFTALIGSPRKRVLVGTDIPGPQLPGNNLNDFAVWRNAQTGEEIARSPLLPAMTPGTMIQPYYFGEIFYEGRSGQLAELKPHR